MIKGKPINVAMIVAWANSIKNLFIPNVSNDLIVDYNIVRHAIPNFSRKIIVVVLDNTPSRRVISFDYFTRLFVVLFVHKFIIS